MKVDLNDYLKLLHFNKPYRGLLLLAAFCMVISTIFGGVSLSMIVPLADRVLTNKKIVIPANLPDFLNYLVDKLNALDQLVLFKGMIIAMILIFLLKGIFLFLQTYLMEIIAQSAVRDVRNKLYEKFQELSLDFYANKRTGELISRVINDVGLITNAISYALNDLIYQSMQAVLYIFISLFIGFSINLVLPVIAFVVIPLIMFPVIKIGKRIKRFSFESQKKMADLNSLLAETIQGAHIVKLFCRENYEIKRFKDINYSYYKFILKSIKRTIILSPVTEFIGSIGAVVILTIVGKEVILGKLSFGVVGAFLAFFFSLIRPIKKLSNVHAINQQAISASRRIYDILEEPPKIRDTGSKIISGLREKIIFENVWFKYDESKTTCLSPGKEVWQTRYVLKNINLEINKGEIVALVGYSGAGKSTLVNLLTRLYEQSKGKILFDNVDIRDVTLKSLRGVISVVAQEMVLFNTTVRDNIAYGREGAVEGEIIEAAKKSFAYEFIMNLPNKFDTVIGDRGVRLSGGEKQRIAIARAILKNSPILIFDEATSQLDSVSEQLIKEALYNLLADRTSFIIAHRLSTIQKADRIIVIENGEIMADGVHSSLLVQNNTYKKLYELQFNV